MSRIEHSPLARALGRVPSGLYIVTANGPHGPLGFLGSFVQQVGFEPPTVVVGVGADRPHLAALRSSKGFAICVLDAASKGLMAAFYKAPPAGEDVFAGLATARTPAGEWVLSDALAWIECKVVGEHPAGDHVVVFGAATAGALTREGESLVHLRRNGLSY